MSVVLRRCRPTLCGRLEAHGYSIATAKGTAKAIREATTFQPQALVNQVAGHLDAVLPRALIRQA